MEPDGDGGPGVLANIQKERKKDQQQDCAITVHLQTRHGTAGKDPDYGDQAVVDMAHLIAQGAGRVIKTLK